MMPQVFNVEASDRTFTAHVEIGTEVLWQAMRGTQFPLISNTATTGHKLQGASLNALLVSGWYYGKNWAYVVLSRVCTMKGLFMTHPLSLDKKKYAVGQDMLRMMKKFREEKTLALTDDSVYAEMEIAFEERSLIDSGNEHIVD